MPRDMSWLSPKRRRTTTALPTVQGGRKNAIEDDRALSPSPRFTSPKPVLPSPSLKQRPSRTFSSASTTSAAGAHGGEGNLFYAYARRADDLRSRYLLTFASAQVANEWWALIQACYPDTTRPGPQLFSFEADDFLEQAWKHAALAHLKPKWMYILSDDSTRGAAQGVIPVQDVRGNLLGGASGSSEQHGRSEAKRAGMDGSSMLEERFEKMMEVVERNAEQISALAAARGSEQRHGPATGASNGAGGRSDMSDLSGHLKRISQMLEQNSAHVASLAQRQTENEERMREMIAAQCVRETAQQHPDMGQLTSHLDRIQKLMERNAHGRKDSARDIRASPPRVDLSPLTFWLEKVLSAVEQNSELVRELLQEKENVRSSGAAQQVELDLSPLSQRLDDLLDAQEAKATRDQAAHTQANNRLDKIIDAQHKAVERGPFDVSLLSQRLDEILSVHRDVATTALTEPLEAIRDASEQGSSHLADLLEAHHESGPGDHGLHDLEPLTEQLEALRATTEQNSATMIELLESLAVGRQIVTESNKTALTPFDDDRANDALERQQEGPGIGGSKFLLSALTSHLSKIQAVTETNANAVRSTRESSNALQRSLTSAVTDTSSSMRELATRHKELAAQVAVREGQVREVVRSQADMVECVRELAKTIKAQEKATCNHVVIPPPRKTNRKVVGFVYDAKEGKV